MNDDYVVREALKRIEGEVKGLVKAVAVLKTLTEKFMATVAQDFESLRQALDAATNAVAAEIQKLVQGLKNSMTDAELATAKSGFQAVADRLTVLGQDPVNPVPPPAP